MNPTTASIIKTALKAYLDMGGQSPMAVESALKNTLPAELELADKPAPRAAYGKRRLMLFYSYGGGVGRNDVTVPAGTIITGKLLTDWEQVLKQRYGYLQVVVTGWQMLEG